MRIAFLTDSFLPALGGAQFLAHHLADRLSRRGHEVSLLADRVDKPDLDMEMPYRLRRVPVVRHGLLARRFPAFRRRLNERRYIADAEAFLRDVRAEVIVAVNTYLPGYAAVRAGGRLGIPAVVISTGADIQVETNVGYGLRLTPDVAPRVEVAIRRADALVAICPSIRDALVEAGADPRRVHLLAAGADPERFHVKPARDVREICGLSRDARVVLVPSRYHVKKNMELAVRMFPRVRAEVPSARLLVVGDHMHLLAPEVERLGLEGIVTLHPALTGEDYRDMMLTADLMLNPSYIEGLSLVFLDAMSAGLPIVASNVPGTWDTVVDGVNGLLVPLNDEDATVAAVCRVLEDPALRARLSQGGLTEARRYDWDEIVAKHEALYRELAGGPEAKPTPDEEPAV